MEEFNSRILQLLLKYIKIQTASPDYKSVLFHKGKHQCLQFCLTLKEGASFVWNLKTLCLLDYKQKG